MRRPLVIALLALSGLAVPHPGSASGAGTPISFEVENLQEPGVTRTIHGTRFDPACDASAVVVLMHGLSYTRAAWNVPGYSVVEPLLDAGVAVVTIDRLGYGESTLENGYNISSEGHAYIASQVISSLRTEFDEVVLGGHSAGAEVTMLTAGLFGGPDAIAVLGYHHFPSPEIVTDFTTGDVVRAAQDDYEYFLGDPQHRAEMFFTDAADGEVVEADAAAAVLTPSGEIFTIGKQPSRLVAARIDVPVFLQLGDSDRLFPVEYADEELALFASAPSVDVDVVGSAGHTFMLHPSGPAGSQRLADWVADQVTTC